MTLVQHCISKVDNRYPLTLIDIGAMGGIPHKWESLRKVMRILAFEPDEREFSKLESNDRLKYYNCLLYSHTQNLKLHISKDAGRSSLTPQYQ